MVGPETTCRIAYSIAKNVIDEMYKKHSNYWRQLGALIHSRWFLISLSIGKRSREFISLSKRQIRLLTGIITGVTVIITGVN